MMLHILPKYVLHSKYSNLEVNVKERVKPSMNSNNFPRNWSSMNCVNNLFVFLKLTLLYLIYLKEILLRHSEYRASHVSHSNVILFTFRRHFLV